MVENTRARPIADDSGSSRAALSILLILFLFLTLSPAVAGLNDRYEWYDSTWRHRIGLNVTTQATDGTVEYWPIERQMNFTQLLRAQGNAGTFDNNSVRVFEYDAAGNLLYEVPSQFDKGENYDNETNAVGELIFNLNGTTSNGTTRTFFIYFDSVSNGPKPLQTFGTNLERSFNGEEMTVNTSKLNYFLDTDRGNGTSGIYKVGDGGTNIVNAPSESDRTAEYIEYTNGTHDFTFNLSGSANFTEGPLRITVTQQGYADYYTAGSNTNLSVTKTYHFYNNSGAQGSDEPNDDTGFVKIRQNITNVGGSVAAFESTPAGGLALDMNRTLLGFNNPNRLIDENNTEPFSYARLIQAGNAYGGLISIFESVTNFVADLFVFDGQRARAGVNMSQVTLQPNESVAQESLFSTGLNFNGDGLDQFPALVRMFKHQPTETTLGTDTLTATINGSSNETVYNRDELARLVANVTSDPFNLTTYMNATVFKNSTAVNDTVVLSQNTSTQWNGTYHLANDSNVGTWTVNFTAYTDKRVELAVGRHTFTVTDEYFANLTIQNPVVLEGETIFANLTVQNFRQDNNITGANISCSYGSGNVPASNIDELGNGRYSLNFTGPSPADTYTLTCNATKNGNTGTDSESFRTEVSKVSPNTTFVPPNISTGNVSFVSGANVSFVANVSNTQDGTASSTNLTLYAPTGWNVTPGRSTCGDIIPNDFCERDFNVSIPANTASANYSINVTTNWTNPDGSYNESNSTFTVEVRENPVLDVRENHVNGSIGAGRTLQLGNFTVDSLGNFNLSNITFTCTPGSTVCDSFSVGFDPVNVSQLGVHDNQTVNVSVGVSQGFTPGDYTGTVNVTSNRRWDTFDLNVNVLNTTTMTTTSSAPTAQNAIVVDEITLLDNQTVRFNVTANNTGGAFAYDVNVSLVNLPSDWSTNTSAQSCGDLNTSESCTNTFFATVPNGTSPASPNDYFDAETEWRNPDGSYDTSTGPVYLEVKENPVQDVPETNITGNVSDGGFGVIGNFTLESIGNFEISSINYACVQDSGPVCDNFTTSFTPSSVSSVTEGDNRSVAVNVSVPGRFPAGTYNGTLNVSSDGGYDLVTVNVTVPVRRAWDLDPQTCLKPNEVETGTVCSPTLNNTGNAPVNISISPSGVNSTNVSNTSFHLERLNWTTFDVTYNVSDPSKTYNASYNVSSSSDGATPLWQRLIATIRPVSPPLINVTVSPKPARQNDTFEIFANISSQTEGSILWANASVKTPTGDVFYVPMQNVSTGGSITQWRAYFPNATNDAAANTTTIGSYRINVSSKDGIGNPGENSTNVSVFTYINDSLSTLGQTYLQGDTGTIVYRVLDVFEGGISDVSVNFSVSSPNLPFTLVNDNNPFTTGSNGYTTELPSFKLNDDFTAGLYTLHAEAMWFDAATSRTEHFDKNYSFAVEKEGLLDVNWDAGAVWAPEDNMTVYAVASEAGTLKNADDIELTVYDPDGNVFFSKNQSEFVNPQTGIYQTWESLPAEDNVEFGMYWARLKVEKGSDSTIRYQSFRIADEQVALGPGPFDINVSLLEQEVPQDDEIDFNITMINKGPQDGDAKVTYWVSQNGTQYAFTSETIFTPPNVTIRIPRNSKIYSNQPPGMYTLNAQVEPLDSSIQPATASQTFRVIESNETEEEPETIVNEEEETRTVTPEQPTLPTEPDVANVSIIDAPGKINLVRDRPTYTSITIANTGDLQLQNLSLSVVGVPPAWVSVDPSDIPSLSREGTETFALGIDPPEDAPLRSYNATLLVVGSTTSTRKPVKITVFQSLEEKIRADIERLQGRVDSLKTRMTALERQGVDVSGVREIVTEIETTIQSAQDNVDQGDLQTAVQDIEDADSLVQDAEAELKKLKEPSTREAFRLLPLVIGLIVLLALILVMVYLVKVRHVEPFEATRERIHGVAVELKKRKMQERQELRDEKKKTKRLIELLEAQHEEGIMDDESYEELRTSAEEKLRRINRKLEED